MYVDAPNEAQLEDLCLAALERSERPLVICRRDVILYVNPTAAGILRAATGADLVGLPIDEIVHPDFREAGRIRRRVLAQSQQPLTGLPAKLIGRDGSTILITSECRPIALKDGVVLVFIWEDVRVVEGVSA